MKKEINPKETSRAAAFELWMSSAMIGTELDCIVNQYTDKFCNPMLMWGSYHRGFFRTTLPISFQFHHVQMDGGEAARFMELLQAIIRFLQ